MNCIKRLLCVLLVMVMGVGISIVEGSERPLEDMLLMEIPSVVTASLTEQTLDKVPGTMTVVTEKQIKLLGLKNLLDVFNIVPGFRQNLLYYATTVSTVRSYSKGSSHIKVMIDGYSINDTYDHGIDAYLYRPLNNVKQIEIIRGPGSCLYGTDAFSAVINIITKKEKETSVILTGGELGNKGVSTVYRSDPEKELSYSVAADYFDENGSSLYYASDYLSGYDNNATAGVNYPSFAPCTKDKAKRRLGAEIKFKYKDLSVDVSHADSKINWTEAYQNIMSQGDEESLTKYDFINMQYNKKLAEHISLSMKAYYDLNSNRYRGMFFPEGFSYSYLPGALGGNGLVPTITAGGYTFYWDATAMKYFADKNGDGTADYWPNGSNYDAYILGEKYGLESVCSSILGQHQVTAGIQLGTEKVKDVTLTVDQNANYLYKTPVTTYSGKDSGNWLNGAGEKENKWAVFLQDIYEFNDKLSVVAGARYDSYEQAGNAFSPRLAVIYRILNDHVVKASYSEAFFAPNASVKYLSTFGYIGDPKLKPQANKNYELSFQNSAQKKFQYAVVLFYSTIVDQIRYNPNAPAGTSVQSNTSKGENSKGGELEWKWAVSDVFSTWGNYSSVKVFDEHTNTDSYNYVENMGNLGVSMQAMKTTVSAFTHMEERKKSAAPWSDINGFATVNAAIVYSGIKNTEISLTARNLLDEKYYTINPILNVLGQPSSNFQFEGRQVLLSAMYKF